MAKMSFADRVKKKAKEAEFQGGSDTVKLPDGMSFFKPKKGRNDIMIIPFEMTLAKNLEGIDAGDLWYRLQIKKHFGIGSEDKAVICPTTIGKKCPICEYRAQMIAQGRGTDDDEVKALQPRKRELYYIIDVNSDEQNVQVFEPSYFLFGRKLEEEIREADDDDEIVANFADPNDGAVLEVRMTEESLGKNKFFEASRIDFEKRGKDEKKLAQKAAETVPPMAELIVVLSYDELKNMLFDLDSGEDADDTRPARKRGAAEDDEEAPKRGKKASRDSADEEEDERPRGRGKSKDEEDDAPEEKPKGAKRATKDADEAPKRSPKKPDRDSGDDDDERPRNKKKVGGDCPGGGTFGEDVDSLDACDDCSNWSDCMDAYEAKQKK